jgi:hypothetical protein
VVVVNIDDPDSKVMGVAEVLKEAIEKGAEGVNVDGPLGEVVEPTRVTCVEKLGTRVVRGVLVDIVGTNDVGPERVRGVVIELLESGVNGVFSVDIDFLVVEVGAVVTEFFEEVLEKMLEGISLVKVDGLVGETEGPEEVTEYLKVFEMKVEGVVLLDIDGPDCKLVRPDSVPVAWNEVIDKGVEKIFSVDMDDPDGDMVGLGFSKEVCDSVEGVFSVNIEGPGGEVKVEKIPGFLEEVLGNWEWKIVLVDIDCPVEELKGLEIVPRVLSVDIECPVDDFVELVMAPGIPEEVLENWVEKTVLVDMDNPVGGVEGPEIVPRVLKEVLEMRVEGVVNFDDCNGDVVGPEIVPGVLGDEV